MNRNNIRDVPRSGIDPGQKYQVVQALNPPDDVYIRAHNQPPHQQPLTEAQIRRTLKGNQNTVTGSFYQKFSLGTRGRNRLRDHQSRVRFPIDPLFNEREITYHQVVERLKGNNRHLAEEAEEYFAYLEELSMYRPMLRTEFQTLFYRKENLDKASARMTSLRVTGSYLAGKIDVCLLSLYFRKHAWCINKSISSCTQFQHQTRTQDYHLPH